MLQGFTPGGTKLIKAKKERRKEERALEDLLDPAGEAGRQEARDEERRQNEMLSDARRLLL